MKNELLAEAITEESLEPKLIETIFFTEPYILEDDFENSPEFKEGVKKVLGICGMHSAFVSSGIEYSDSINLITNILYAEINSKLSEDNKEAIINSPIPINTY